MSKEKKKQIIFHVVNSNSERCNNTEFSIQLTHYCEKKDKDKNTAEAAYFIDLDWNNSQYWGKYIVIPNEDKGQAYYIDELMFDFKNKSKSEYICSLSCKSLLDNNYIHTCVSNPQPENEIKLSEVELDLFENTIFNIINELTAKEISKCKKIHFILDMPIKKDLHSDKIVNHLLLDQSSPLYKKFNFGKYSEIAEYKIILYMLTDETLINHQQHAKNYLDNLIKNNSYSSIIDELNREDKLEIYYISDNSESFDKLNSDNGLRNIKFKTYSFENHDVRKFKTLIKELTKGDKI